MPVAGSTWGGPKQLPVALAAESTPKPRVQIMSEGHRESCDAGSERTGHPPCGVHVNSRPRVCSIVSGMYPEREMALAPGSVTRSSSRHSQHAQQRDGSMWRFLLRPPCNPRSLFPPTSAMKTISHLLLLSEPMPIKLQMEYARMGKRKRGRRGRTTTVP